MSSKTTNYNLHKIDLNDAPPDITVVNENWDKIDEELADRLPLSGGELTGELIVNENFQVRKNFNDIPYRSYIRPTNYELGDEYSTALFHYKDNVNNAQFLFNKHGVALRDNVDSKLYHIFGQHNTDLAKRSMQFYYDLTEIGVTVGSETIESIARGLPFNSRLVTTIGSSNNLEIYPNSNYGLLVVEKTIASRIAFKFINNQGVEWIGHYAITTNGNTWTGWNEQFSTKNPNVARKEMGLGDTTGALPIANGGTGATTASAALSALGGQSKITHSESSSSTAVSCAAGTTKSLRSVSLAKGTYLVMGFAMFEEGTTHAGICINTSTTFNHQYSDWDEIKESYRKISLNCWRLLTLTSTTTVYLLGQTQVAVNCESMRLAYLKLA